ncbi:short chain type [Moniliophthora roreri]|uniref:Short-chain dehydrogenase reductase sdr n=1 Tax=Moniliophthora roreri TaxID=221103 RepID=A0A0W0GFN0_MONRR|nr:short chain type [Moniliophthora roreri]
MSSRLVAFILGAGSNVGRSVALKLKEQSYAVAVGSRNPDKESAKKDGFFPVTLDITNQESIIKAFETVKKELGAPNVVIYNAAILNLPEDVTDPLTLAIEGFNTSIAFGQNVFLAAQQALPGFRSEGHKQNAKAFIATGNLLPFRPATNARLVGLSAQKIIESHLVELFNSTYLKEGIRFHYAHFVAEDGSVPPYSDFRASGPDHARAYWDLISAKEPEQWDYRFVKGGKKYEGY